MSKPKYAVVVVHGIGAGTGDERKGFSTALLKNVQNHLKGQSGLCWEEAEWEDVNENVDHVVGRVIRDICAGYLDDVKKRQECLSKPWLGEQSKIRILSWLLRSVRRLLGAMIWLKGVALTEINEYAPDIMDAVIDVPLYLDANHGERIREKVRVAMDAALSHADVHGVVLVGHSLGSVIAYDTVIEELGKENGRRIVALVTMGSPLGWVSEIRNVEKGVDPSAAQVAVKDIPWINFWDAGDPVPERKHLNDSMFAGVKNEEVKSNADLIKAHCAYWQDDNVAKKVAELCCG